MVLAYWLEEQQVSVIFTSADLRMHLCRRVNQRRLIRAMLLQNLNRRKLMKGEPNRKAQAYRLRVTAISEVKSGCKPKHNSNSGRQKSWNWLSLRRRSYEEDFTAIL